MHMDSLPLIIRGGGRSITDIGDAAGTELLRARQGRKVEG